MATQYFNVEFADVSSLTAFSARLMDYVASPAGIRHMAGDHPAVVWNLGALAGARRDSLALFMSHGALVAARKAGLTLPMIKELTEGELPTNRTLLLEDASDVRG